MSAVPPQPTAPDDELVHLRNEVARLTSEADSQRRRGERTLAARRIIAAMLVVLAAFGAGLSVIGVWAARTSLDTDRWVSTVGPLPEDPEVRAAVSTFLTDEVFSVLEVQARVQGVLPPGASFLASPLTGQVREVVRGAVDDVIATPAFRQVWEQANRIAHEQIVAIVEGGGETVRTEGGKVTLNLLPAVNEVLRALEAQASTLFGRDLNLPTVSGGEVPAGLRERVETGLGVTLPPDFAEVTIYRSEELSTLQDAADLSKQFVIALVLGTLAAGALALWISANRRRTALQLGVWLAVAVVVLTVVVRTVRRQLLQDVEAGELRDGVDAAVQTVFAPLRDRGDQLLVVGILLAVVAYLTGPGQGARAVRRSAAAAWRWTTRHAARAWDASPDFAGRYLDALRIAGVVAAALVALAISTWDGLVTVLVVLGAFELGVTLVASGAAEEPGEPARKPAAPPHQQVRRDHRSEDKVR